MLASKIMIASRTGVGNLQPQKSRLNSIFTEKNLTGTRKYFLTSKLRKRRIYPKKTIRDLTTLLKMGYKENTVYFFFDLPLHIALYEQL